MGGYFFNNISDISTALDGMDAVLRITNPYGERQRINNVQGAIAVFLGKVLAGRRSRSGVTAP